MIFTEKLSWIIAKKTCFESTGYNSIDVFDCIYFFILHLIFLQTHIELLGFNTHIVLTQLYM